MKIKKTITEKKEIEVDIETPAYFKNSVRNYAAIYSEDIILKVCVGSNGFAIIQKLSYRDMYKPEEIMMGESITEEEFNTILADAINTITSIPVVSYVPLNLI